MSGSEATLAACPHRPPCSACPRFGERGIAPGARAVLAGLARDFGLPQVAVVSGSTAGFRLRARLAIRGRVGSPKIGLFESGTHRVVHIPNCSVHHPLINRAAAVVRRALAETRISSYSDAAHVGLARYLQVAVERRSQTAQLVLVANSDEPAALAPCLDLIGERLGAQLHSLWCNVNRGHGNSVLGPVFHHWLGPPSVIEHFGGAAVHYPPGAFGQNNLDSAQSLIAHVAALIPQGAAVAEFYAGVGAIGLSVLNRVGEMRLNEVSEASLSGLQLGIAQLTPAQRAKISVIPGPAAAACGAAAGVRVVIANPPRKGLDLELVEQLSCAPPQRFVYVSCGLESLVRDAARLTASGRLTLSALTAFDLMPFTEHVESVACFDRL